MVAVQSFFNPAVLVSSFPLAKVWFPFEIPFKITSWKWANATFSKEAMTKIGTITCKGDNVQMFYKHTFVTAFSYTINFVLKFSAVYKYFLPHSLLLWQLPKYCVKVVSKKMEIISEKALSKKDENEGKVNKYLKWDPSIY